MQGGRRKYIYLFAMALAGLVGCTPSQYASQADRAAYSTLRAGRGTALGQADEFDITYNPFADIPSEPTGTIEFNGKVIPLGGGQVQTLTLDDCLKIAHRNSRSLQSRKESLFSSALALASESRIWNWSLFEGDLDGDISAIRQGNTPGDTVNTASADGTISLTQRFFNGGILTLAAMMDFATSFVGSDSTFVGSLLSASFTQPLLRGAWGGLAFEDQYRIERDFLISVFQYERFTQTFSTDILTRYYLVLRQRDRLANDQANIKRLTNAVIVAQTLVRGGQKSRLEADQAEQNLINAQVRYQQTIQQYEDALDNFKLTIGLPIEAIVDLNYPGDLDMLNTVGAKDIPLAEAKAITIAMKVRPDVLAERADLRDANRNVEIAANNFLPSIDVNYTVSAAGTDPKRFERVEFHKNLRTATLQFNYNLDQTDNRNAYRNTLIARDKARRDYDEFVDIVRLDVRRSYRSMRRSHQTYDLQKRNVEVARRRLSLAVMRFKGGQAAARDVLEADEDLLNAENGLTSALIDYTTTRLIFLADMGMIWVDQEGGLHERQEPFEFNRISQRYEHLAGDADKPAPADGQ